MNKNSFSCPQWWKKKIESDVDSTKCDLSTALDTDACPEIKKSDTNYENKI